MAYFSNKIDFQQMLINSEPNAEPALINKKIEY